MRRRLALAQLLLAAACSRDDAVRSAAMSNVGARCLDCHGEITRAYRRTGMARATDVVRPGELEGLATVRDGNSALSYAFAEESGPSSGPVLVESWKDAPLRSARLGYAIGAGLMDRSYAAEVGGLDWFAPLEVVARGGSRAAALSPGHSMHPGTRFAIPIAEECLACHTDRLPPREYPLNLRPTAGTWSPDGISCAACHGDVEAHAAQREKGAAGDPILVPGREDPVEGLSLCARCHLQGDASFLLEPGARGIAPYGSDLLERRAVFVAAQPSNEIGFVSQVERLVLSRCLTQSLAGGTKPLTCTTCHDPHRSSFEPEGRAAVRARCDACHPASRDCALAAERRTGHDCVECHMRRTPVFDVATVEIHDHWIRKIPGAPSRIEKLRTKESKDGGLALFAWPGRARPTYAEDPGLWMMAFTSLGRRDLALARVDREPGPDAARLPTYHHLRGTIFEDALRWEDARAAYERALAVDPAQAESAVNLGVVLGRLGRAKEGIARLDDVIRAHPQADGALRNRGVLKLSLGDGAGFAADLEAAYAVLPQASVARALAQHHARAGRADAAETWSRRARGIDPD